MTYSQNYRNSYYVDGVENEIVQEMLEYVEQLFDEAIESLSTPLIDRDAQLLLNKNKIDKLKQQIISLEETLNSYINDDNSAIEINEKLYQPPICSREGLFIDIENKIFSTTFGTEDLTEDEMDVINKYYEKYKQMKWCLGPITKHHDPNHDHSEWEAIINDLWNPVILPWIESNPFNRAMFGLKLIDVCWINEVQQYRKFKDWGLLFKESQDCPYNYLYSSFEEAFVTLGDGGIEYNYVEVNSYIDDHLNDRIATLVEEVTSLPSLAEKVVTLL